MPRPGSSAAPAPGLHSIHKAIYGRQLGNCFKGDVELDERLRCLKAKSLPALLREDALCLEDTDKIFASQWLSNEEVVFGTKCNQLFVYNIPKKLKLSIPLLQGSQRSSPVGNCGIHSIAINPSKTLLATGGVNPNHIGVYKLPSFEPLLVCEGHKDWVFSLQWMSDDILVSGSRDAKVCWWSISRFVDGDGERFGMYSPNQRRYSHEDVPACSPAATRSSHTNKVRDLKYNPRTRELATLSADTSVKIWDTNHLQPVSSVFLSRESETVCMALDEKRNTYAVGSQSHITFVDPRSASVTHVIKSLDRGSGVRSLSIRDDTLTIGGGLGRLSFYDLRLQRYINVSRTSEESFVVENLYHTTGSGWLQRNEVYHNYFWNVPIHNAIYTHCYDDAGERMFVAGGPLQLGLCGGYAAIWTPR